MYREAWRVERDWFYDRNLHGLDVKAAEKKYEPYLRNVASREDLTYLFQEMLGNMTVSHMGTGGGDTPEVKRVQTGLLGADYEVANGSYRFSRVYNGENWNPQLRAPLTQPGVNVKAGEYLLAVNGREVRPPENVYSFFEGMADKSVLLRVGADANGAGAREVTVVPVADESRLRNLAWIEENRRKVDQMTGGKVAYIYMPDTANGGLDGVQSLLLRADRQAGGDRGRALQRRRPAGHGHRGDPESQAAERGGQPRGQRPGAAAGHLRAEGDDHQRARRLGRRRDAVVLQARRRGQADRHAHVGRPGRDGGRSAADGRRLRRRAEFRDLQSADRASGKWRTSACRRISKWSRTRRWCGRAATRNWRRRWKWRWRS